MVDGASKGGLSGIEEVGTDTYLGSHTGGVWGSCFLLGALAGRNLGSKIELDAIEAWDRVGSDFRGALTACQAGGTGGGGTGKEFRSSWCATCSYTPACSQRVHLGRILNKLAKRSLPVGGGDLG